MFHVSLPKKLIKQPFMFLIKIAEVDDHCEHLNGHWEALKEFFSEVAASIEVQYSNKPLAWIEVASFIADLKLGAKIKFMTKTFYYQARFFFGRPADRHFV